LVGSGAVGNAQQGWSVALSSDGNTAIVGGPNDNPTGAVWVFTRSGGVWTQQGDKLVGTSAVVGAHQGYSVSLSSDGNIAIVGDPSDNPDSNNHSAGAVWVFTRSGGVWTQQGDKLVGTGAIGNAQQGYSVSLSGDGNTAIVGGPTDNTDAFGGSIGAAWIFTNSGGVWTQQGPKLVKGNAQQGNSVSLSGDGNTAIVGAPDGSGGAAWVYTRSGGVWTQQGPKLVNTDWGNVQGDEARLTRFLA
jgi:lipocalin